MPAKITVRPVKKHQHFYRLFIQEPTGFKGLERIQYGPGHESSLAATSSQTDSLSMQVRPKLAAARCNLQGHTEDDEAATVCLLRGSEGPVDTRRMFRLTFLSSRRGEACGMRCEPSEDVTKETGDRMEARVGPGTQSVVLVFVACWGG